MSVEARTGIEIFGGIPALAQRIRAKTGFTGYYQLRVTLDRGKTQKFTLGEPHFVDCAAGDHELIIKVGDKILGPLSVVGLMTRQKLHIDVVDGQITEVAMMPGRVFFGDQGIRIRRRPG